MIRILACIKVTILTLCNWFHEILGFLLFCFFNKWNLDVTGLSGNAAILGQDFKRSCSKEAIQNLSQTPEDGELERFAETQLAIILKLLGFPNTLHSNTAVSLIMMSIGKFIGRRASAVVVNQDQSSQKTERNLGESKSYVEILTATTRWNKYLRPQESAHLFIRLIKRKNTRQ